MQLTRAYTVVRLKNFSDDAGGKRLFTGIASSISVDRMQDVVMPRGMIARLPVALLWQHDASEPVGWVRATRTSDTEIEADFEVATISEPGPLRDRLDGAWTSLRIGLVGGLSIGFRALKSEPLAGGGMRWTSWEMLEVSCVTIAANSDCSITAIKSADQAMRRAASGAPAASAADALERFNAAERSSDWRAMSAIARSREFAAACAKVAEAELAASPDLVNLATLRLADKRIADTRQRIAKVRIVSLEARVDQLAQRLSAASKAISAIGRKGS